MDGEEFCFEKGQTFKACNLKLLCIFFNIIEIATFGMFYKVNLIGARLF